MFSISIIIPCKNEEKYISRCIDSLLHQEDAILDREIVVIDNGSTDNTLNILENYGDKITYYVRPGLSIAGLRNFGVTKSKKDWIAFIDADVEVDKYWAKKLVEFHEEQKNKGVDVEKIITGSTCLVPNDPTWIEQVWYDQLMSRDISSTSYINSGNMILHRDLFNRLGGFDVSFKTGEEENLCKNARLDHDVIILKNDHVKAIHHGYPKSVGAFFRRMRWHGQGMAMYLRTPWKSKPLLLAGYYLMSTMIFSILFITLKNYVSLFLLFLLFQILPVFYYAALRCRGKLKHLFQLTFLYFCFGWARAISIFDIALQRDFSRQK